MKDDVIAQSRTLVRRAIRYAINHDSTITSRTFAFGQDFTVKFGPSHVRWLSFPNEDILGAVYTQGEPIHDMNNDLFYTYGGADLTIDGKGQNIQCNRGVYTFDVEAKGTIQDTYRFPAGPGGVRVRYADRYAAAYFLQKNGYPPIASIANFTRVYSFTYYQGSVIGNV